MKKKVLYGAALALFASVSMGTLQSCKDDLSDLKHQTQYDNKVLQDQINDLKTALENCKTNCNTEIEALKTSIANLQKQINDNKEDADATKALAKKLEQDLKALSEKVNLMYTNDKIDSLLDELKTAVNKYSDDQNAALKVALEEVINEKVEEINALIGKVKEELQNDYNQKINNLKSEFETTYGDLPGRVTALEKLTETQQGAIEAAQNEINELWKQVNSNTELIGQVYQALTEDLDELKDQYAEVSNNLDQLYQEIYGTGGLQEQMLQLNQALRDDMIAADEEIYQFIEDVRGEASMYWRATEAALEELRQEDEQLWQQMNQLQEMIGQVLKVHQDDIEALEGKIADLETKYNNLVGRVDALITGILLQATDNPVFGNFSLPIGVKNNMLFNWYGYNSSTIREFPSNSNNFAYNDQLAGVDFTAIGAEVEPVQQGFIGDVNLGTVYLTLNPIGHVFDNTKFTLETSAGKPLPFGLTVTKSNNELFFGYSRATIDGNGFYKADVKISGGENNEQALLNKGIDAIKLTIDENLKSAVKDVLKDRTKRNAVELLKAVYNQMSNQLPAYAVRYDWKDADGNPYAVLSNYDLAIATAKPLSYQFYYGESIDRKLPTFGHINNVINELKGKFKIEFEPISFENVTITLPPMDLSGITVDVDHLAPITVHVTGVNVNIEGTDYPVDPFDVVVKVDDINNLVDDLADQISTQVNNMMTEIKDWTGTANTKISEQLKEQLQPIADKINNMVGSINDQIDDFIDDVAGKAQPWFNRLNKVVDLYNKVAGKINNVLENPNHYLQVAMFYNQADSNFGILSNSKKSPTPFKGAKGSVGLYASSYSAELVAPAFKKFVAVSNVYNSDGSDMDATEAENLVKKANSSEHFNKVMDGCTIRYSLPVNNLEKNKIYEIVYQGLDFHGVTSTQKFYITVK